MPNATPYLTVRDALGNQREIEILRTPFTLGRQADNDLVLLDSRISRSHAPRIVQDEQGYLLEDVGSRHSTFVNGEKLEAPRRLKRGDQISLGKTDSYALVFVVEEAVLPGLLEKFGKAAGQSSAPQLHHLGLLLQMAQMLLRAPALEEVLTALVDSAVQLTCADRGLLFLAEAPGELRLRLARGTGGVDLGTEIRDYSQAVVERVAASGQEEVLIEEASGHSMEETGITQTGVRGVVAVPLQKLPLTEVSGETLVQSAPELLGLLYLDSRSHAAVTGLDRQVLRTLAVEGATVIQNARLFRTAREHERIQHELFLAKNIQQSLLPRALPQGDYFQVAAVTISTEAVGGDYYDVVELADGRCGFALADVSGKGLPAAMMAASLQGAFGAFASAAPELGYLFGRVNGYLCERTPAEMYATVFYGVLDREGVFDFVNAGHVPPLLVRAAGGVDRTEALNVPIGLIPRVEFQVDRVKLQPGDLLVTVSDGVTEAHNAAGELFGDARLLELLQLCTWQPPEEVCRRVLDSIREFVEAAPQSDDITVTVVRYGAP